MAPKNAARRMSAVLVLSLAACATPPDLAPLQTAVTVRPARVAPALARSDFGRAVARAVAASPAVGRSLASLRERQADLLAAGGTAAPQLSMGLRPGGGTGFETAASTAITQLVFDAGAGRARQRAAEARVIGGIAGRIEARSQATFEAVIAWAEVVTARQLMDATARAFATLEETEARIAERTEAGAGTNSDLLTAQSRLANERVQVIEAGATLARAEAAFVEIFGQVPPAQMDLPPMASAVPEGGLEESPLLLEAKAAVLAAEADVAAAKAGRMPALSVRLTGILSEGLSVGPVAEHAVAPARSARALVAASQARLEAKLVDLNATRRELESRLNQLSAEASAATDRLSAARAAVEANRANVATAREQFEIGRSTLIVLFDVEREALASDRLRITAERDRVLSSHALLALTGDILTLFGIDATGPDATNPMTVAR